MKYKYLCVCLAFLLTIPTAIAQSKYKVVANKYSNVSKIVSNNKNLSWKQWEENLYEKFVSDLVFKKWTEMPQFYAFEITFDVSDDRKVSNIKIKGERGDCYTSETKKICTFELEESDADLLYNLKYYSNQILKSYEGSSILKFPKNSTVKSKSVIIGAFRSAHLLDKEWLYEREYGDKEAF